ncbi:MAG: preprotein translocase subunit SecE [Thermomicrobiales bacterium]
MSTQEQTAPKRRSSRANAKRTAATTQRRAQAAVAEGASTIEASPTAETGAAGPAAARPRVVEGAERTELAKAEGVARRERKAAAEAEGEKGIVGRVGGRFEPVRNFARESMSEIRKVNWPDQETTRNLTILVIAVSAVLGIFLGGLDFVLLKIFEAMP